MKKEKNFNDYVYISVIITVLLLIMFYIIYVGIFILIGTCIVKNLLKII